MKCVFGITLVFLTAFGATNTMASDTQSCLDAPFEPSESANQRLLSDLLDELRGILTEFPSLLSTLNSQVSQICLSDHLFAEKAYLDANDSRIVLATDMSAGMMLVVLLHEVRHADQLARGICPSDDLAMEQYARATLSLEADANVVSLIVAWQQRNAGNLSLWRALEDWPMIADVVARFEETMVQTQDISAAATAAFDQWYASEKRRELYYVASCSAYLDRQDEAHALPRYLMLPADHFDRLCHMPDGLEYKCEEPQDALER